MDRDPSSILLRMAENVIAQNISLDTLSRRKVSIEQQHQKAKTGMISVLLKLAQLVKEQVQFGKDFTELCDNWDPFFHSEDAMPLFVSERLQKWHHTFQRKAQELKNEAAALVDLTRSYKTSVNELTREIQTLHLDGIMAMDLEIEKIQTACLKEEQRLSQARTQIATSRDNLIQKKTQLERDCKTLQIKLDNVKSNNSGMGFSIAGVGMGVTSLGLLAVCPPLGAAAGLASLVSSLTGLGIGESRIKKTKELQKVAEEISQGAEQLTKSYQTLEDEAKTFNEQSQAADQVAAVVKILVNAIKSISSASESLARASIQRHGTSFAIGTQISGIYASSTALEMATTNEHLLQCLEDVLRDFSYTINEHRLRQLEWHISTPNFPPSTQTRVNLPVRLESLVLSQDTNTLIGTVAVASPAANASVVARYTLDHWKTHCDIIAGSKNNVGWREQIDKCKRFEFRINLAATTNLEERQMELCVKSRIYCEEVWDNNNWENFQVRFQTDDIALYKVLDELAEGLVELQIYENVMSDLRIIEDRDDYEEIMRCEDSESM